MQQPRSLICVVPAWRCGRYRLVGGGQRGGQAREAHESTPESDHSMHGIDNMGL